MSKEVTTAATNPAPLPLPSSARISWNWSGEKTDEYNFQQILIYHQMG